MHLRVYMLVVNNDMYVVSRHGAEQVEAGSSGTSGQPRPQRTFVGAGYRLGETDGDTTVVPGAAVAASQRQVNNLLNYQNQFLQGVPGYLGTCSNAP